MTDVVEIAKERQATLAAENAKLDDFICMAETLLKYSQLETDEASAADGNGAESEYEDLPVLELKAGKRARKSKSRTSRNKPAPVRRRGLARFTQTLK